MIVCLIKIQRSLSCNLSSRTPRRSCQEKQDHGNSSRNCGHIIGCASLLKEPISITHRHRRQGSVLSRLLKLIRSHSSQQNSSVGDSALSCTAIFNDQARHFNLQLPQVSSSSVLLYYQATKNGSRLNTRKKNWNGLVEVFLGDLKLCFQNVVTVMRRQIHNKPCARRRVNR